MKAGSALVFNVHSRSEKAWLFVCDTAAPTQDLNTEEMDLIEADTLTLYKPHKYTLHTHAHRHRCKDTPLSTHTHTSHD